MIPNDLLSLNELLGHYGIRLGFRALSGEFELEARKTKLSSAGHITHFPKRNSLFFANLQDDFEVVYNHKRLFGPRVDRFAVLGLLDTPVYGKIKGKIGVFTDSSCLERPEENCLFVLEKMLDFAEGKTKEALRSDDFLDFSGDPRSEDNLINLSLARKEIEPLISTCHRSYDPTLESENLPTPLDPSTPLPPLQDYSRYRVFGIILLALAGSIGIILLFLRQKKRKRHGRAGHTRIPKYSVIYI